MPNKKSPEMAQVYQNEFVFGEGGGKGTSFNHFIKSLSKKESSKKPANPHTSVKADDVKVVGASFSHMNISPSGGRPKMSKKKSAAGSLNGSGLKKKNSLPFDGSNHSSTQLSHPYQSNIYMDSDDDWDADFESNYDADQASGGTGTGASATGELSGLRSSFETQQHEAVIPIALNKNKSVDKAENGSVLRPEYSQILEDPFTVLHVVQGPNMQKYDENLIDTSGAREEISASISRFNRFAALLRSENVNVEELRKLSWNGIPPELKAIVWQLLSGYLSTSSSRRVALLKRKRDTYMEQAASVMAQEKDSVTWHQITIDIPRTNPHIKLYSHERIQRSLEKLLYLWAVRHPASGYVQGINDICTPFFQVFLSLYVNNGKENVCDLADIDPEQIPDCVFDAVEADTYWCLTKLLDSIQDNYIHAQPGIIRQVNELKDLTKRIDSELVKHLENEGIEFLQFSFRWMNCLLMRELSMSLVIRMWDTYLTEGSSGFSEFHVYVCAAFLVKWSDKIKQLDFQEMMIFLQSLPTKNWTVKDVELLMSEAFMWQSLYKNASAHLR